MQHRPRTLRMIGALILAPLSLRPPRSRPWSLRRATGAIFLTVAVVAAILPHCTLTPRTVENRVDRGEAVGLFKTEFLPYQWEGFPSSARFC